jgi:hypothetical protein
MRDCHARFFGACFAWMHGSRLGLTKNLYWFKIFLLILLEFYVIITSFCVVYARSKKIVNVRRPKGTRTWNKNGLKVIWFERSRWGDGPAARSCLTPKPLQNPFEGSKVQFFPLILLVDEFLRFVQNPFKKPQATTCGFSKGLRENPAKLSTRRKKGTKFKRKSGLHSLSSKELCILKSIWCGKSG